METVQLQDLWMKLSTALLVCFMVATANEVVFKSFNESLTLPCGCHENQNCYSVINNNINNTGSYITKNGTLFLPSGTWDVQGKVCCGDALEQLQCRTVCSYTERCAVCSLTLSANVSSVDGMIIRATQGVQINFNVTFTHQDHNAFTFRVNKKPYTLEPNFTCTEVRDTNIITQTLLVQYHCDATEPGNYSIDSYVTFCNFDYPAETKFVVIVANATKMVSPTAESDQSTSSTNQSVSITASSHASSASMMASMMSSAIMPTNTPTMTTAVSTTNTNDNQDTDDDTTITVIAVTCTCILLAVVAIIGILLKMSQYLKRHKIHGLQQTQEPVAGDSPMNQTQYEINNRPISNISNDSDTFVPVDHDTLSASTATVSLAPAVMSAPTQEPGEEITPRPDLIVYYVRMINLLLHCHYHMTNGCISV